MRLRLELDYTLGAGALGPYLDALREGRALAARRRSDSRTTFPPERVFGPEGDGTGDFDWVALSGRASLLFRTDGPAGGFSLVQFDGADNRAVAGILNVEASGSRAVLRPTGEGLPGIAVLITEEEG